MTPQRTALFDRRLIVVMGKGGVGRTTASAALALAAARQGKRVCLVELSGLATLAPLFGLRGRSYDPRPVSPNVDLVSLSPEEAVDDFGRRKLRVSALLRLVFRSRVTKAFIDAVPGLHDLLQLGKIENMVMEPQPGDPVYDLLVLDAPATGHGLTLLSAAHSMTDLTRVGPFAELARIIASFLADPERCALVLVTLPEALPVNESVEMVQALHADGAQLSGVIVNKVRPRRLPEHPPWPDLRERVGEGSDARIAELIVLADREYDRQRGQARVLQGIEAAVSEAARRPVQVQELPRLPHGAVGRDGLEALADQLAAFGAPVPTGRAASGGAS